MEIKNALDEILSEVFWTKYVNTKLVVIGFTTEFTLSAVHKLDVPIIPRRTLFHGRYH